MRGESPVVHRRLREARGALDSGRPAAALPPLARALAEDPACAYAWFLRAGVRVLLRDRRGAEADLDALGRLPASAIVRYREFDAPAALRWPSYPAAVDRLLARRGAPAWGFVLRAFALRESHRFPEAVAAMERAVAAAPRDAGLRGLLSRVRFVNRFPKKGLSDLNAALRLDPSCGWLHAWKGEALRHLGRPDEALAALEKAIALDPSYFRAFAWRGGIRASRGSRALALADLDRALSAAPPGEPSLSWIYNERMRVRRALGDVAGALADLNAAHALNSRYGWSRPGGSDFDAADAELSRFLRRRPRHAWARAWRGWTRLEAGRPAEALADLGSARRAWPLVWRGRARLMLGDRAGALRDFTRAVGADESYAPAWAWRGGARRSQSDLSRAIALDPILAWAWAWRGELRLGEGRLKEALNDVERSLTLNPSYPEAQLIRQRIIASLK
ncbi:MAG: tetratricopeptide repeat protein [Elusimicrobia bacterium]|nr:tetratricopeptide repeat protein [Elusimicrobiota bacterium]